MSQPRDDNPHPLPRRGVGELIAGGNISQALIVSRRRVRANPLDPRAWIDRGLALEAAGRIDQAERAMRRAGRLDSGSPEPLVHRARLALDRGQPDDAQRLLDRAQRRDPTFEPIYCQRIALHNQRGQPQQAVEAFYTARLFSPECPTCLFHLAEALLACREQSRAAWCWQRWLEISPDRSPRRPHVRVALARVLQTLGRIVEARRQLDTALLENPGFPPAMFALAKLLLDESDPLTAAPVVHRLIQVDGSAMAHALLGRLRQAQNQPRAAREAYEQALRIDPTHPGVHQRLACLALAGGERIEAVHHLRREMALRPGDPDRQLELANLLLDAGDAVSARVCLQRGIKQNPNDRRLWQNLSVAEAVSGRPLACLAAAERAVEIEPTHVPSLHNLSLALLRVERLDDARRVLSTARQLAPTDLSLRRLAWRVGWRMLLRSLRRIWGR